MILRTPSFTLMSRLPEIVAEAEAKVAAAVEFTAFHIEGGAKQRARYKTGFMRGEIQANQVGHLEWEVIGGANYTIFHEYGTVKMEAQPMFVPASEDARPIFEEMMREVYR